MSQKRTYKELMNIITHNNEKIKNTLLIDARSELNRYKTTTNYPIHELGLDKEQKDDIKIILPILKDWKKRVSLLRPDGRFDNDIIELNKLIDYDIKDYEKKLQDSSDDEFKDKTLEQGKLQVFWQKWGAILSCFGSLIAIAISLVALFR